MLEQLGQSLSRLMRFKIMKARTRVQEHALSQVFEEVRGRLNEARTTTNSATHQLQFLMNQAMGKVRARADAVTHKLAPVQLQRRLSTAQTRFESAYRATEAAMKGQFQEARKRLGLAAASLDALSPLAVLQRGYAIAQHKDGRLLRDTHSVSIGDQVRVRLARGRLDARVESIE